MNRLPGSMSFKAAATGPSRSPLLGCQTLFLGLFALVGLLAALAVAIAWLQGLSTWFWDEATCTIESSEAVPRPEYDDFEFRVAYRYHHRADSYRGEDYRHGYSGSDSVTEAQRLAGRYAPGEDVQCWVDPDDPARSYLRRSNLWEGLWILVPLLFVGIGGGPLWLLHGRPLRFAGGDAAGASRRDRMRPIWGPAGVVVSFGIFFLFGTGFLIPFFVWPALQVAEARSWAETPCEILSSGVRSHASDDGTTYSVEVLYRYEFGGREYLSDRYQFLGGSSSGYESKQRIAETIPAGSRTVCWVDPSDPFEAVVERGFTADYLFGLVPLLFAAIGLGGMLFAVHALRGARRDAARPSWARPVAPGLGSWLHRGADEPAAVSAGPVTLEPTWGPFGKLGCAAAVALFWNGIVSLFVWQLVAGWRTGDRDWFLALFLTPFVLVGLLLLAGVPYSLLALLNPRPRVRLSRGTIPAGESAQLEWAFRGFGSRIRRLRIWLEPSRKTTERGEGSVSVRTEPLESGTVEVLDRGPGEPREFGAATFTVPADAPPSTEGDDAISWKLKLQGEIAYWPDVHEEYEIRIAPGVP